MARARDRIACHREDLAPYATGYVPVLDGFRGISIFCVVFVHATGQRWLPANEGLMLFFFVSGMLITGQLAAELERSATIDLRRFYLRRALRLLPAALAFITITGAGLTLLGISTPGAGWLSAYFYGANYYEAFAGYNTHLPHVPHPFRILWSLAVEEHFYFLWPALLLVLCRWGPTLPIVVLIAVSLVIVPAWRAYMMHHCPLGADPGLLCGADPRIRIAHSTDTRIDAITWGALCALLILHPAAGWYRRSTRSGITLWMGGLFLVVVSIPLMKTRHIPDIRLPLLGMAYFFLVPALIAQQSLVRRLLECRPLVYAGKLSYSIYLWHWAAITASALLHAPLMVKAVVRFALTVTLPLASYYGLERPLLGLRKRFGSKVAEATLGGQVDAPEAPLPAMCSDRGTQQS